MIEPILFFAATPKGKDDELRAANALSQLTREDETLRTKIDPNSGKMLVLGMGEFHLDAVRRRLRRDFGVQSEFGPDEVLCSGYASYDDQLTPGGAFDYSVSR